MIRHTQALLAMLALTGCASIPQLDAPPALRDPATLSLGVRPAAAPGAFPDDRWWTAMGDPALDRLMEEALSASPDLAAAQARARRALAFQAQAKAATLPALPGDLPLNLVGRRPDLVSARLRAESASARIGIARAAFYPDINLAALVGFQAIGLANLFQDSSLIANAGPALRLPIFDGGAARAGYRAARADYDEAVSLYNTALITAIRQVADAAASKASLTDQIAAAQNAVNAAQRQLAATRQRHAAGLDDLRRTLCA